ncbi:MAG: 1-(5-phosphoribosyl)-5-[(5-phosphoribosylamino)methylideneamino]imidazole-4-carboxamide isomerase [Clostridiales bacterium]|jgi:phosphoribosylformimino-5-aminoimidazole carboxamide ribotide isomerase|nr:1-(5-phosphoribosyl)-5-[(5-phosphoribosylamino)methylideneamino]imidazole-4-carboxamide isomerase [Clostridiales bacterium]
MRIYPAIDIKGGQCVRLKQGDFDRVSLYSRNPADQAEAWQAQGASFIHCVDLDGARHGEGRNNEALKAILSRVRIPIQTGGGIRTLKDVDEKIDMGVCRVILGTAAIKAPQVIKDALKKYNSERIVIGVDAKNGFAAASGWEESSSRDALELCLELKELGIRTVIYTDISKDGMMQGPNLEQTSRIIQKTGMDVIASGGVSSMEDLKRIEAIGASGAIVGQALFIGAIRLREAVNAYEANHTMP